MTARLSGLGSDAVTVKLDAADAAESGTAAAADTPAKKTRKARAAEE